MLLFLMYSLQSKDFDQKFGMVKFMLRLLYFSLISGTLRQGCRVGVGSFSFYEGVGVRVGSRKRHIRESKSGVESN